MTSASATVFVLSSIAGFALLRGIAAGLMALARRLPAGARDHAAACDRQYLPARRLDTSVGDVAGSWFGRDGNDYADRRQSAGGQSWRHCRTARPSFYFIDIPATEADRFNAFNQTGRGRNRRSREVPMLRGRIVASARRSRPEDLKPRPIANGCCKSDRGLTATGEIPKGSKIVEGEWWGAGL